MTPSRTARGLWLAAFLAAGSAVLAAQMPSPAPSGRVTVRELLLYAYDLLPYQLLNAPEWTASERFSVEVTIVSPDPQKQRDVVQQMLADRFALQVRRETRDLPIYRLQIADENRRLGPQLRLVPEPDVFGATFEDGMIVARGIPWGFLGPQLAASLGRVVVDETGITGPVDMIFEWTPDTRAAREAGSRGAVDIFSALYEQLGLMLASGRGQVDVVVVERVQRPAAN